MHLNFKKTTNHYPGFSINDINSIFSTHLELMCDQATSLVFQIENLRERLLTLQTEVSELRRMIKKLRNFSIGFNDSSKESEQEMDQLLAKDYQKSRQVHETKAQIFGLEQELDATHIQILAARDILSSKQARLECDKSEVPSAFFRCA